MVFGVVYLIWNKINGKKYVGQTITFDKRINEHKYGDQYIDRAIKKYGWENFRCGVIKSCASKAEMDYWEKYFIVALHSKTPYGYNCTDGGEGTIGLECTPEHRAKLSVAFSGEKNPFFGKHHTDETRAKISAKKKGTHHTDETRAKMSKTHKGKHLTDETRAKMSAKKKGIPKSPEHRAKLAEASRDNKNCLGRRHTKEELAKMSAASRGNKNWLGKHHTKESRAKMSAVPKSLEMRIKLSAAKRSSSPYKNLLEEILARKLTYTTLAKLMEISIQNLSRKMRGERNFTARDAAKLEEIFGKSAEYLLERTEP
ncbi:MAG: GIY-YIG nuclease family protein [Selenomonadaceae bacterium]|nr:GIY-YIG nuclease family protein [Selenomonadaceae bacterium]